MPLKLFSGDKLGQEKLGQKASPPVLFYGWVIVAVCVLTKVAKVQGQNNVMAYTVPHLEKELRLSDGQLGMLFSIATVSASSVQPIFGRCVDRLGARLCIPLALVSLFLTLNCFSLTRRTASRRTLYLEVVVLFFFLRSLALGALEIFPSACVQKWFVRRRGRALAIVVMFQQFGNAIAGPVVELLVHKAGWRTAARAGSLVSLALVPVVVLFLRKSPEACGLAPDGDAARASVPAEEPPPEPAEGEKEADDSPASPKTQAKLARVRPRGLPFLYIFSFFYALMFGGCDFDMVGMVAEAGGIKGGVDVGAHIFMPMALVCALATPLVGEITDRSGPGSGPSLILLGFCGLMTALVTNMLCYTSSPLVGVLYGGLRGTTQAVFGTLLTSGLAFAAMGVTRDHIGKALGMNQLATIAGTGVGPLLYGSAKDTAGSFTTALRLSSLPPLLLGISFLVCASSALRSGGGNANATVSPVPGRVADPEAPVQKVSSNAPEKAELEPDAPEDSPSLA